MPPAHTPSQTRGPRSGAQTATIAAIMRGLLTETAHVGMQLADLLHCLVGWHGSIIQYRMLHLFVDSFKSDNEADEALLRNLPWCSAIHGAPYRCCRYRRLATGSCPKWQPEDQVRSREKPRVFIHRTPDSASALGRGIRAFWPVDYTLTVHGQITDGSCGCGIRNIRSRLHLSRPV